jgi:micrococcal nuclease
MFKESIKIIGAVCLAFLILFLISKITTGNQNSLSKKANEAQVIATQNQEATLATTTDTFLVSRVVDGDTIDVEMDGKQETVRLIGVNTPETVDPRKPVQCFGHEASDFVKKMLTGQSVRLEPDATQANRDKYGRLLRYVYLGDILVDEEIISAGYGYEYTYDKPYQFQKEFKASQAYASAGGLGLWASSTCGGKLN